MGREEMGQMDPAFDFITDTVGRFAVVGMQPTGDCLYLMSEHGGIFESGLQVVGGLPLDLTQLGNTPEEAIEVLSAGRPGTRIPVSHLIERCSRPATWRLPD